MRSRRVGPPEHQGLGTSRSNSVPGVPTSSRRWPVRPYPNQPTIQVRRLARHSYVYGSVSAAICGWFGKVTSFGIESAAQKKTAGVAAHPRLRADPEKPGRWSSRAARPVAPDQRRRRPGSCPLRAGRGDAAATRRQCDHLLVKAESSITPTVPIGEPAAEGPARRATTGPVASASRFHRRPREQTPSTSDKTETSQCPTIRAIG